MEKLFFITPIGDEGSEDRKRADLIFRLLIQEICKELEIEPLRADKFNEATLITHKIFETIFDSDYVICDLANNNPNVFYEMAVRHSTGKPIIHIARKGQSLPFDIKDFNTIFIDHTDVSSIDNSKIIVIEMIERSKNQTRTLNPVTVTADLNNIEFGVYHNKDMVFAEINRKFDQILELLNKPTSLHSSNNDIQSWTGRWISNIGYIDLIEDDEKITGEYQYYSDDFIGNIAGKFWNESFIFQWHWKDKKIKGVGYWKKSNDGLNGFWFFDHEIKSISQLKEAINNDDLPAATENREWNIYGKQKLVL